MADWDDGWYCECCTKANVQDIICIEITKIPYTGGPEDYLKLGEHYFCEKCAQKVLETIKKISRV